MFELKPIKMKKITAAIMSFKNSMLMKGNYAFFYEYPSGYKIKLPIEHDNACDDHFVYFMIKGKYWGARSINSCQGKKFIIPSDTTPDPVND